MFNNLDFFIDSKISLHKLIERFPIGFLDRLLKVSEGLALSHAQPQHSLEDSEMRFKELISILLSWNLLKDCLKDVLLLKTIKTKRVAKNAKLRIAKFVKSFTQTLDETVDDAHIVPSGSRKYIKQFRQIINVVLIDVFGECGIEAFKDLVAWLLDAG